MKYLVFDTETNDLPDYKKAADEQEFRLAEIAIFGADENLNRIPALDFHSYVHPDGWEITPKAHEANGLTIEFLKAHGMSLESVLIHYSTLLTTFKPEVICHNSRFDCKVMRGELRRAGMDDLFEQTPTICTMNGMTGKGVKKLNGKGGSPRLIDVCAHFDISYEESKFHGARYDAEKTLDVARAMKVAGILPEAKVYYAKNKPNGGTDDNA